MAFLNVEFFSHVLGMDTSMNVLLPEKRNTCIPSPIDKKYPVLYLLHGHSDNQTSYMRKSLIEILTRESDLIVVMPNGYRGFYTDSFHGHKYFTYFTEELPTIIHNFFHASDKPEDTYISGLSMGGYGALKIGLTYPERFAAVSTMSALIVPEIDKGSNVFASSDMKENTINVFGSNLGASAESSLINLADKTIKDGKRLPRIYQFCGEQDMLFEENCRFAEFMKSKSLSSEYEFIHSEGNHNWFYWNKILPELLIKMGVIKNTEGMNLL